MKHEKYVQYEYFIFVFLNVNFTESLIRVQNTDVVLKNTYVYNRVLNVEMLNSLYV